MKIIITEEEKNRIKGLYEKVGEKLQYDGWETSPKAQYTKDIAKIFNQYYGINLSAATTGSWTDKDYNDTTKRFMEENGISICICKKGDGYCHDDGIDEGEVTTKDRRFFDLIKQLKGQQQGKVNTEHDRTYDYQLNNGKYYFKGKENTQAGKKYPNWVEAKGAGLESIKKNVKFA